jgi:DNA-binding PadR family transcriptional regulator
MASPATRLLVLGVVGAFGKAHGYLVRTQLVNWAADEWAHIKWGSIYHSLRQMAKEGLLEAHDSDAHPWRVDYSLTAAGRSEYDRLRRQALSSADGSREMLNAGLAFLVDAERAEAIRLLEERLEVLLEQHKSSVQYKESTNEWDAPEHVHELVHLWMHDTQSDIQWTQGLIARLRQGSYRMRGEAT